MEFTKHKHPLILIEKYQAAEDDVCYICREAIYSGLIHSVYRCSRRIDSGSSDEDDDGDDLESYLRRKYKRLPLRIKKEYVNCAKLFMHKSCAELPLKITNYCMHPHHTIVLHSELSREYYYTCSMCDSRSKGLVRYYCQHCHHIRVCIKCITSPRVYHPGHNEHELTLVQHQASFRCYACTNECSSSSSCKCNKCPFWIDMKCALLPSLLKHKFHRHPLLLSYSLSQQYLRFRHHCSICRTVLSPVQWLYHCANCRFLAHIRCATSTPYISTDISKR